MKIIAALLITGLLVMAQASADPLLLIEEYYKNFELEPHADNDDLTLADLLARAQTLQATHAQSAEAWLAVGLIRAAYAKAKGGIGGLSELRQARRELEQSIALDANAAGGTAKAFLGRLYATVPSWPLAFGSNKRAMELLSEASSDNPSSLPANYYYALLLAEEDHLDAARDALERVKTLTPPCSCDAWESTIKHEAQAKLKSLPKSPPNS